MTDSVFFGGGVPTVSKPQLSKGMTLGEIRQMLGKEQLEKMRKHPGTARLPGGESQYVSAICVRSRLHEYPPEHTHTHTTACFPGGESQYVSAICRRPMQACCTHIC